MYTATGKQSQHGFDNAAPEAPEQLSLLSEILNRHTFGVLTDLGVGHGWRCWDIGAGDGSVARWMAARVGMTGHVVASDLKPDHVPGHPRIETIQHDITGDPWPEPEFDLIHARLVLMHLADREELAVRLAAHLRPGGALVLTDWYCGCATEGVVASPVDAYTERVCRLYHDAVHVLSGKTGMDMVWASRTAGVLRAAGHTDVSVEDYQAPGQGGTPTARLARLHSVMLEPYLVSQTDLTVDDLAVIRENLLDPEFEMVTNHTYTTVLRAPK
ncbi:methyltransferase domain-containing protein [Streptosporangiaceae bacterium NEAU-GS5]|nr:methyltransferase domain-containing protein [Streptosporangiaceae bacterium NEAU-GS5]